MTGITRGVCKKDDDGFIFIAATKAAAGLISEIGAAFADES